MSNPGSRPRPRRTALLLGVVGALVLGLGAVTAVTLSGSAEDPRPVWRAAPMPEPTGPVEASPSAPAGTADTISMSATGDIIMAQAPGRIPPNNGRGFFNGVKPALAADLVMGNLEEPLTEDTGFRKCGANSTGCHQFRAPPSYAAHLRDGGFQLLNLANNHGNDFGDEGHRNTQAALEAQGLLHTGDPGQITVVTVKGVRVAVLGFSSYHWSNSLVDIDQATTAVKRAAAQADLVVVQVHMGAEGSGATRVRPGTEMFLGENRGDLIKFSHAVIDAGADVVFGHGPHVMRGMEFYKGRLIAYSLGNFCGYKTLSSNGFAGVGGVLKVTLKKDGSWSRGELVPTEMVRGGYPAPDPDKRALAFVNDLSEDDFGDSAATISTTDGTITAPADA